jgi:hypothetical protein
VALTVLANGCYRWLGRQLRTFDKAAPKQVYRKFVEAAGVVEVQSDRVIVHFDKRAHNPILRQAELDREPVLVPWLYGRQMTFEYA